MTRSRTTSSFVGLVAAVGLVSLLALAPSRAAACTDSGMPVTCEHPAAFDAGAACVASYYGCGCWFAECDAGAPDGGGIGECSPFVDAGADGPVGLRFACATTSDCLSYRPDFVCGADGFCACTGATPMDGGVRPSPGGSSCSVGFARTGAGAWSLALLAALAVARRRRARDRRAPRSASRTVIVEAGRVTEDG